MEVLREAVGIGHSRLERPDPPVSTDSAGWFVERGLSARTACRQAQLDIARIDRRFCSLEGDLALPAVPFDREVPDRHIQLGISEANMLGFAAGLARRGKIPFVNSFASFIAMRACEQVRLDVAYHRSNVKLIGAYAGIAGGPAGPTHHATEDMAVLRAMPEMVILSPADALEAYKATWAAAYHEGPVYLRVGRADTPRVYETDYCFEVGAAVELASGSDVTIVATGGQIVHEALVAADALRLQGICCTVLNVHTVKPLDSAAIIEAAASTGAVVTVEEHNVVGGLGGAVAEVLMSEKPVPVWRLGIRDAFCDVLGPYEEMLSWYGLDASGIAAGVHQALALKGGATATSKMTISTSKMKVRR